jgi:hypothetical protein
VSAKYPRSFHLPWSPGGTRDDKRMETIAGLIDVEIVVTEKLDGSNLAMTRESVFARSHSGPPGHPSFAWAKALHAQVRGQIDSGITLFGEYCFAVHSIEYQNLPGYFFLFGVREDETGFWWDWDMVEEHARALGVKTPPLLFRGLVRTEIELRQLTERLARGPSEYGPDREGIVVRVAAAFTSSEFAEKLGKHVRADHITTSEHWMFQEIRVQGLLH